MRRQSKFLYFKNLLMTIEFLQGFSLDITYQKLRTEKFCNVHNFSRFFAHHLACNCFTRVEFTMMSKYFSKPQNTSSITKVAWEHNNHELLHRGNALVRICAVMTASRNVLLQIKCNLWIRRGRSNKNGIKLQVCFGSVIRSENQVVQTKIWKIQELCWLLMKKKR